MARHDIGLHGYLSQVSNMGAKLSQQAALSGYITIGGGGEYFPGPYDYTPTGSAQVLETKGKTMKENLTIAPVPSNYGLITWNGAFLTVS